MEIVLGVLVIAVLGYFVYQSLNKEKADGSHPLDSVTPKTTPVITETAPVVIEQVPVAEEPPAKKTTKKTTAAKKPKAAEIGRAHV